MADEGCPDPGLQLSPIPLLVEMQSIFLFLYQFCYLLYKETQPVHPEGDQSWVFIGRTDAEAETPILWQRMDSLEKTLMLGRIEGGSRSGRQRMRWLDGITDSMNMS